LNNGRSASLCRGTISKSNMCICSPSVELQLLSRNLLYFLICLHISKKLHFHCRYRFGDISALMNKLQNINTIIINTMGIPIVGNMVSVLFFCLHASVNRVQIQNLCDSVSKLSVQMLRQFLLTFFYEWTNSVMPSSSLISSMHL
jgi:hypothetical protein